jgi:hypothetical protein
MTILHLGVIEQTYAGKGSISTVEVAQILEDKYHVMQTFADLYMDVIVNALEKSTTDALENILNGDPVPDNIFAPAESQIEKAFKFEFLEQGAMEVMGVAGVPTQASIDRRASRFSKGKSKTARPSFIDTGVYENSFKAWIE